MTYYTVIFLDISSTFHPSKQKKIEFSTVFNSNYSYKLILNKKGKQILLTVWIFP